MNRTSRNIWPTVDEIEDYAQSAESGTNTGELVAILRAFAAQTRQVEQMRARLAKPTMFKPDTDYDAGIKNERESAASYFAMLFPKDV